MSAEAVIVDNGAWVGAAPKRSALIPLLRDDPTRLLAALDRANAPVELARLDDGSGDLVWSLDRAQAAPRAFARPLDRAAPDEEAV